jgi:hypothetical protein
MLVAAPEQRGTGVGRALVAFAEQRSRERGLRAIQLELLLPRTWQHPSKEFLKSWYGRIGYRRVRTGSIDDVHPHLAPLLATPCDLAVYEKPLLLATRPAPMRDRRDHADPSVSADLARKGRDCSVHYASTYTPARTDLSLAPGLGPGRL